MRWGQSLLPGNRQQDKRKFCDPKVPVVTRVTVCVHGGDFIYRGHIKKKITSPPFGVKNGEEEAGIM